MNRRAKLDAAIALSSAEKSVTVQTHKPTDSNRYIHTLPIGHVWIKTQTECYSHVRSVAVTVRHPGPLVKWMPTTC